MFAPKYISNRVFVRCPFMDMYICSEPQGCSCSGKHCQMGAVIGTIHQLFYHTITVASRYYVDIYPTLSIRQITEPGGCEPWNEGTSSAISDLDSRLPWFTRGLTLIIHRYWIASSQFNKFISWLLKGLGVLLLTIPSTFSLVSSQPQARLGQGVFSERTTVAIFDRKAQNKNPVGVEITPNPTQWVQTSYSAIFPFSSRTSSTMQPSGQLTILHRQGHITSASKIPYRCIALEKARCRHTSTVCAVLL